MELRIDKKAVIPEQNLEGKLVYIGKITHVFPCDFKGRRVEETAITTFVGIQILNTFGRDSVHVYSTEEYKRFQEAYGVNSSDHLIGKPVVSVYTPEIILTGLIPLNLYR